jgi:hypothetical protein
MKVYADGTFIPDELTEAMTAEYPFELSYGDGVLWGYSLIEGEEGLLVSLTVKKLGTTESVEEVKYWFLEDVLAFGGAYEESSDFGGSIIVTNPSNPSRIEIYKYYETFQIGISVNSNSIDGNTQAEIQEMFNLIEPILDGGIYEGNTSVEMNQFGLHSDYSSVVDNGDSFINFTLEIPEDFKGSIQFYSENQLGKIEGYEYEKNYEITSGGSIELSYTFSNDFDYYLYEANMRNSVKEQTFSSKHSGDIKVYLLEDLLQVEIFNDNGEPIGISQMNVGITSTPIFLVHGFTGDKSTWKELAIALDVDFYTTIRNDYYFDYGNGEDIPTQSDALNQQIHELISLYKESGIYIEDVDIIGHSMGGLISRYMIQNYDIEDPVVRKLIMVGTPNHGTGLTNELAGKLGAWNLGVHEAAAEMLYSNSEFIINLNAGEFSGEHLHPEVEYGIIYGTVICNDDMIVTKASALLEGVPSYELENSVHSQALLNILGSFSPRIKGATKYYNYDTTSITQDERTFEKIKEWLAFDIGRIPMSGTKIMLDKVKGNLNLVDEMDGMTYTEGNYDIEVQPLSLLTTGENGYTVLSIIQNSGKVAEILINENTSLNINFVSASSIEIDIYKGSARFVSESSGYHFAVDAGDDDGTRRFISLDTDFIVCNDASGFYALSNEGQVIGTSGDDSEFAMEMLETDDMLKIDKGLIEFISEHDVLEDDFWEETGILSEITGYVANQNGSTAMNKVSNREIKDSFREAKDEIRLTTHVLEQSSQTNRNIRFVLAGLAVFLLGILTFSIIKLSKGEKRIWILGIILPMLLLVGIAIHLFFMMFSQNTFEEEDQEKIYTFEVDASNGTQVFELDNPLGMIRVYIPEDAVSEKKELSLEIQSKYDENYILDKLTVEGIDEDEDDGPIFIVIPSKESLEVYYKDKNENGKREEVMVPMHYDQEAGDYIIPIYKENKYIAEISDDHAENLLEIDVETPTVEPTTEVEVVETFIFNISVFGLYNENDIEGANLTINGTNYILEIYNNELEIPIATYYDITISAEGYETYTKTVAHEDIEQYNNYGLIPIEEISESNEEELARLFLDVRDYETDDFAYYNIVPISNCEFDAMNQELIVYDTIFSFTVEGVGYPPLDVLDLELSWFETDPVIYLKLTMDNAAN